MALGRRSGVIHTLESLIAAILFLLLVVTISQQVNVTAETGPDIAVRERNVVETLDLGGRLRDPVVNRSLDIVRDRVDSHLTGLEVEISALYLNTTADTAAVDGTYTDTFTVNASVVQRQTLRLWFEDADAANVSVNGNYVTNHTGAVDGYEEYDISAETVDGSNELQVDTGGPSTVSYSVDIYELFTTGSPPTGTDVVSTVYPISGRNVSFAPAEVSVQAWQ